MPNLDMTRRIATILATTAAAFALAACGQDARQSTVARQVDSVVAATETIASDLKITTRVTAALAREKRLEPMQIDVDTHGGRVTISGLAPDTATRRRVTRIAHAVEGVVSVENRLVIGRA